MKKITINLELGNSQRNQNSIELNQEDQYGVNELLRDLRKELFYEIAGDVALRLERDYTYYIYSEDGNHKRIGNEWFSAPPVAGEYINFKDKGDIDKPGKLYEVIATVRPHSDFHGGEIYLKEESENFLNLIK